MIPQMDIKRTAALWSISERRVNELCRTGRIDGAHKENGRWLIPANAIKPTDERYSVSAPPVSARGRNRILPLPVGISDYKKISREYYYVDKTLLIKEILDEKSPVSVFLRPRSFGKTLNMDMLKVFFEISDSDNTVYFKGKKIWESGEEYRSHMGRYPVAYISFKDIAGADWEETRQNLKNMISDEFWRHKKIMDSPECTDSEKNYFMAAVNGELEDNDLFRALSVLIRMLSEAYESQTVLIVDEFDTLLDAALPFSEKAREFEREFLGSALKNRRCTAFSFFAGVNYEGIEEIFGGINGYKVNTVLSRRSGEYFGFTQPEVDTMINLFETVDRISEIRNWYFGYRFGESDVYNPWSVISYFNEDCHPLAFWETTGDNTLIDDYLISTDLEGLSELEHLMQGKTLKVRVDFTKKKEFYQRLLCRGFLKATESELQFDGDYVCTLQIPDREIRSLYGKRILEKYSEVIPKETAEDVRDAIYIGEYESLRKHIHKLIRQTVKFNSEETDIFYHGLVLGLCAMLGSRYYITAEKENETGNFSIEMIPLEVNLPGILIMTKFVREGREDQLEALARFACKQITNRQYENETKFRYVNSALKYGIAYSGRTLKIIMN